MTVTAQRPPQLARLDFLVGEWRAEGTVYPGRFGPGGPTTGTAEYAWALDGKWLLYTSRLLLPGLGPYEVRGGVALNPRADRYDAFAYNTFGVLLAYTGAWEVETRLVFDLAYPAAGEKARVVYVREAGGAVRFISEAEAEGGGFAPYFETRFTRGAD